MFRLLVGLLRIPDRLQPLAVAGAWEAARLCAYHRGAVGPIALELGVFDLVASHLRALGSPSDWLVGHELAHFLVHQTIREAFYHLAMNFRADFVPETSCSKRGIYVCPSVCGGL